MSKDAATDSADYFAAAAARKRALAEQLSGRPIEEVIGVVHPSGRGGWPEKGNLWTLSFSFQCWKIPPGPMKTRELFISMTGSV